LGKIGAGCGSGFARFNPGHRRRPLSAALARGGASIRSHLALWVRASPKRGVSILAAVECSTSTR